MHMKNLQFLVLLAGLTFSFSLSAQDLAVNSAVGTISPAATVLTWDKTSIDLGVIRQNNPVEVSYSFTNTGSDPIVITDVQTSCGCTAAKHSEEPVKPGESSKITVTYNAKNQGVFQKTITVKTSTDANPTLLTLSGEVK
jgi:hypothetical protein